jgi:hypothetical protein
MEQLNSFDQVKDVEDKINETKVEFEQKKLLLLIIYIKGN